MHITQLKLAFWSSPSYCCQNIWMRAQAIDVLYHIRQKGKRELLILGKLKISPTPPPPREGGLLRHQGTFSEDIQFSQKNTYSTALLFRTKNNGDPSSCKKWIYSTTNLENGMWKNTYFLLYLPYKNEKSCFKFIAIYRPWWGKKQRRLII
jgi:hypothetical protein